MVNRRTSSVRRVGCVKLLRGLDGSFDHHRVSVARPRLRRRLLLRREHHLGAGRRLLEPGPVQRRRGRVRRRRLVAADRTDDVTSALRATGSSTPDEFAAGDGRRRRLRQRRGGIRYGGDKSPLRPTGVVQFLRATASCLHRRRTVRPVAGSPGPHASWVSSTWWSVDLRDDVVVVRRWIDDSPEQLCLQNTTSLFI